MSVESFHQRHRQSLQCLSSDEFLRDLIDRHANDFGIEAGRPWEREWDRLMFTRSADSDKGPLQALVLVAVAGEERSLCTVEVGFGGRSDPDVDSVALREFPSDSALSTLNRILEEDPELRVVRYRPEKRCTMETSRAGGAFVKVFSDDRGAGLYRDGVKLWNAGRSGAFDFAVSQPLGYDRQSRAYTQRTVPGQSLTEQLFADGGHALAYRLGAATASIPTSGLEPADRHGPDKELNRTRRRAEELGDLVPSMLAQLDHFLSGLEALHARLGMRMLVPVHGSPHPNQWLLHETGLGLVDFDRLALGDPELDVATFTTEVEFEAAETRWDVMAEFERGYRDRYGDLDDERLLVYESHKRLAKVYRTARAIRPTGDERAIEILADACDTLTQVGER